MSKKLFEEVKVDNNGSFNDSRRDCVIKFQSENSLFRRLITQGFYWTSIDKDLANQFIRDERWFLGMKFWDSMKIIDHGSEEISKRGTGFYTPNK